MSPVAPTGLNRRLALSGTAALLLTDWAQAEPGYPNRPIEIVVPASAGGGTDVLARAFSEAVKKHLPQPMTVNNKPGASGAIGMGDVLAAKPDGYKVGMVIVELTTVPHLGLAKFTFEDFVPIARLNFDPAAITVRAEAPWNTIEEFLAAAKQKPGEMKVGNSGNGSIWHLAAAALEDKTGTQFTHVPYQGAAPGVVALLGGHIDAVAVSPGEVSAHVAAGKLKTLVTMSEQRVKGFDKVPTLRERQIDLAIGAWRGLAVAKGTPAGVVAVLKTATAKAAEEPAFRQSLDKLNLGFAYADADAFRAVMQRDHEGFKVLIAKLGIKA
ncbi:tripartite tricarboxylate transporter substrate binding protein [Curvibacter sp. HBC28]|uniref:Tripartite tricarboxylate transporter substrate binding protein n=1 Tax=Curvibacter microcysteis TaxID=3026419 RepID=A0ABT5MDL7_9BURK|nr:tripartite tricarboxylate transporter substrate binding protein [Curvibacter sp. HBC28]MDD0814672.1 tripartite tricarboxylate transporter substrate binding protein [Curvibacter sp. HBC28]